jgi:hypothetical protein
MISSGKWTGSLSDSTENTDAAGDPDIDVDGVRLQVNSLFSILYLGWYLERKGSQGSKQESLRVVVRQRTATVMEMTKRLLNGHVAYWLQKKVIC